MIKPRGIFVTGTDTGVGKTVISSLLAKSLKKFTSLQYYKPIQTGYLEDDDTTTVARRAGLSQKEIIEPAYRLVAPQSPNRAAALEAVDISLDIVFDKMNTPHFLVVEGAGGLEVPIREQTRMTDLVKDMNLPMVLVASTRLGTINHTLLSCQWAQVKGLNLLGVILSGPEDVGLCEVLKEQGVRVLFSIPFLESEQDWLAAEAIIDQHKDLFFESQSEDLRGKDKEMIWHPFTQHSIDRDHHVVTRAQGAHFYLENGKKLIDGISSWWVNVVGHSHPVIAKAIAQQAHSLEHVIFAGFTHKPAVQVSENILGELQSRYSYLKKVFFSDNGSTAVEVALKMAYQYASLQGEHQRTKFMALRGSYHGDTLGAMSVGEPEGFHTYFKPLMMPVDYLQPDNMNELNDFAKVAKKYAACIVEPLIQGAGGMRIYSVEYLAKLAKICKDNDVLLICDEIFTGFYRTGEFLASYKAQIEPDLICLSKGLTGGFLPLALTVTSQKIYDAFLSDHIQTAFLHGHSYTGNPMACAAAHATFGLLKSTDMQQQIALIETWTTEEISKLKGLDLVENPRSLGTIGAFDVAGYKGYFTGTFAKTFSQICVEKGVYIKPLGGTIYTVPPYCVTEKEFRYMYQVIRETLYELRKQ